LSGVDVGVGVGLTIEIAILGVILSCTLCPAYRKS